MNETLNYIIEYPLQGLGSLLSITATFLINFYRERAPFLLAFSLWAIGSILWAYEATVNGMWFLFIHQCVFLASNINGIRMLFNDRAKTTKHNIRKVKL